MNFQHRLKGYDSNKPESCQLVDCVDAMTDRAEATLKMIQNQFIGDGACKFNDELIFHALDAVLMDILDTREAVNSFYASKREE